MKYFKITNKDEKHYDYQYHDGLNILNELFNKTGSCVPGGLYYTTLEHISNFYHYGVWLREVTIPDNAQSVMDPRGDKWRADRIILGKRHRLADLKTIKKFNLKVDEYIFSKLSSKDHIPTLDWMLQNNQIQNIDPLRLLEIISQDDQDHAIKIYEWLLDHSYQRNSSYYRIMMMHLLYPLFDIKGVSTDFLAKATQMNNLKILEWFKKSELKVIDLYYNLSYSSYCLSTAADFKNIKLMDWWLKYDPTAEISATSIEKASRDECIEVLDWWKKNSSKFNYDTSAISSIIEKNCVKALKWWLDSGLEIKITLEYSMTNPIDYAIRKGYFEILEMLLQSSIPFKFNSNSIVYVSEYGHIDILNWLDEHYGVKNCYDAIKHCSNVIDKASINGKIDVLEWWLEKSKSEGFSLNYTHHAIDDIFKNLKNVEESQQYQVIEWWRNSGLEMLHTVRLAEKF